MGLGGYGRGVGVWGWSQGGLGLEGLKLGGGVGG